MAQASTTCTLTQIEWMRRQDLVDELALQQGPEFDPRYRLSTRKMIDPELFVRGDIAVSGPESNQTLTITVRVEDAKTGTVRGTTTLHTTADHFFADVAKLSGPIGQLLCEKNPWPPRMKVTLSSVTEFDPADPGTKRTWSGRLRRGPPEPVLRRSERRIPHPGRQRPELARGHRTGRRRLYRHVGRVLRGARRRPLAPPLADFG